jgi:hypothetical protein
MSLLREDKGDGLNLTLSDGRLRPFLAHRFDMQECERPGTLCAVPGLRSPQY